jgi:hypothetical protein
VIGEKAGSAGLVEARVLHEPSALVLRVGAVAEPELQDFIDARFHRKFLSQLTRSLHAARDQGIYSLNAGAARDSSRYEEDHPS